MGPPSDVNFCVEDCECNLIMASISKEINDHVKAKKCFEPSSSSLSCQRWVRTTHSNYVYMVHICNSIAKCCISMIQLSENLVCNWSSIFTKKQKDIKYAKDTPKVRTKHLDHKYCMPSSSRCYTLQWILWRTFATRM